MDLDTETAGSKAAVLLSGGLDSATTLAMARADGHACYALSFDYGQRHAPELQAARHVATHLGVIEHRTVHIDLRQFGGSALTDSAIAVPRHEANGGNTGIIPVTYVPARNTIFLAYALGWAEVLGADHIYIGVNAIDYSGYPDCRPEYIRAFKTMANLATRRAIEGHPINIHTPLIDLGKSEIIRKGVDLGIDYSITVSCYQADSEGRACGVCDSCQLRMIGFAEAGIADPTRYAPLE